MIIMYAQKLMHQGSEVSQQQEQKQPLLNQVKIQSTFEWKQRDRDFGISEFRTPH